MQRMLFLLPKKLTNLIGDLNMNIKNRMCCDKLRNADLPTFDLATKSKILVQFWSFNHSKLKLASNDFAFLFPDFGHHSLA